jgi:Ca2+-binding RTX toxin-like protein
MAGTTVTGGAGDDTLLGGDDADVLTGNAGNDLLQGFRGADRLLAGDGSDTLYGGAGNDVLIGDDYGGAWSDWLYGGAGNDNLSGYGGDDFLDGGTGRDFLQGGDGNDTFRVDLVPLGNYAQINAPDVGWDTVLIAPGLRPEDLRLARVGEDLVLRDATGTGEMRILGYFREGMDAVEWFRFESRPEALAFGRSQVDAAVAGDGRLQFDNGWASYGVVTGTDGANELHAGTWGQVLHGMDGNDTLVADAGGGIYDVTHIGGKGNDFITGGYARDFYRFDLGDGQDTIVDDVRSLGADVAAYFEAVPDDPAYQDRVVFGAGINEADVHRSRVGSDLVLQVGTAGDRITVNGWFDGSIHRKIEEFVFTATGTVWIEDDAEASLVPGVVVSGSGLVQGGSGDDWLTATGYGSTLEGGTGNDHLEAANDGGVFNLAFECGEGDDVLVGSYAGDTYRYQRGDGNDLIVDDTARLGQGPADYFAAHPEATSYQDHLYLGEPGGLVYSTDVLRSRAGDDLVLALAGGTGRVTIAGWFDADGMNKIEVIHLADRNWSAADAEAGLVTGLHLQGGGTLRGTSVGDTLVATAYGTVLQGQGGSDILRAAVDGGIFDITLQGGTGDDQLVGSYARDFYRYTRGDGNDRIVDDVQAMGPDVAAYFAAHPDAPTYQDELSFTNVYASEVTRVRDGQDLVLQIAGGGSVRIEQWFDGTPFHRIEKFTFPGGNLDADWAEAGLSDAVTRSGGGTVSGAGGNDNLTATDYGTTLLGKYGDDVLSVAVNGSVFDVTLDGGMGNDTLIGSYARDFYRVGGGGHDLIVDDVRAMGSDVAAYFQANQGQDTYQDHLQLDAWSDDVWVSRTATDLVLHYGLDGTVTVQGWFDGTVFNKIEVIGFADGTSWNIAQVEQLANAGWG